MGSWLDPGYFAWRFILGLLPQRSSRRYVDRLLLLQLGLGLLLCLRLLRLLRINGGWLLNNLLNGRTCGRQLMRNDLCMRMTADDLVSGCGWCG